MLKYRVNMTVQELEEFMAQEDALDAAYADYYQAVQCNDDSDDDNETEADLYRYWK